MIKLLRVAGHSLYPLYQDGDYVLALHPILAGRIKPRDVVVFRSPAGHTMIKLVERVLEGGNDLYVVGTHTRSMDSRDFGAISHKAVIGKVVWHFKKPR